MDSPETMTFGTLSATGQRRVKYPAYFRLVTLLLGSSCLLTGFGQAKFPKHGTEWDIQENGYFRADLGRFFQEQDQLDVYQGALESGGTLWDTAQQKYMLLKEVQPSWKGEPYYHELFRLENGQWIPKQRSFSQVPDHYLDFGPCDARNQLDLPDEPLAALDNKMRNALPRGSKIKAASQFNDQFVTVIYSRLPKGEPSIRMTGTYPLYVALLVPHLQNWQIVATHKAEDWAYFCGSRTIPARLADGANATVLLVYASAPQGSRILSVSRSIRSFIVSHRAKDLRGY